jgi:hypothetical protein
MCLRVSQPPLKRLPCLQFRAAGIISAIADKIELALIASGYFAGITLSTYYGLIFAM